MTKEPMKHTKGRLRAVISNDIACLEIYNNKADDGFIMADMIRLYKFLGKPNNKEKDYSLMVANAHRIALAWNACEGVSDEDLKLLSAPDVHDAVGGNLLNGTMRTIEALKEALDEAERVKAVLLDACKHVLMEKQLHGHCVDSATACRKAIELTEGEST
jgi:uncharacterized 2Fe-2S/4Fe-4S cluster protein (DUF4445 family)